MRAWIVVFALFVCACAKSPSSIAPAAVPVELYKNLSCTDAPSERERIANNLASLETQQRQAVVGDAIGVFLIAVPVSSLFGGDVSGLIATERGKLLAIDARIRECGVETREASARQIGISN